tara:strand:+ start:8642 stop:9820 length:1179 start_codon:yes stop_codon:yes gene_type:complete
MAVKASGDPMKRLKAQMAKALDGFESGLPKGCDPCKLASSKPDRKQFPLPELVLFALRNVMGFSWSGPAEKVAWSVYATVKGEPFIFELGKFGFTILRSRKTPLALLKRVEGQLSSSLRLLEPLLSDFANHQIDQGNLTLSNRMGEFSMRYNYFREIADRLFGEQPGAIENTASKDASGFITGFVAFMNADTRRQREGYFASVAMVDAYFSRLEHRILMLRAFVGRSLGKGGFSAFLKMDWDDRLREIADFDTEKKRGRLLGKLREVKSSIRNPLSHGGVRNDGGAFHIHLPGIGAIPADLSRNRDRLNPSFFPIADTTHAETCALFDEFDATLAEADLTLPDKFVQAGIDPEFNTESLARYAQSLALGHEAVDALIDRLGYEWERHANMDY